MISPSLPRYLVAAAAVGAVLAGTVILFVVSRRAGRLAAARRARRDQATDGRTELSAATAAVAQQIIDLDRRYARALAPDSGRRPGAVSRRRPRRRRGQPEFAARYRALTSEYTELLDDIAAADRAGEADSSRFTARAEALAGKLRRLGPAG